MISPTLTCTGSTFLHRLDARFKILAVVALSFMALQSRDGELILLGLFWAAAVTAAGLRWRSVLAALRPLVFFASLVCLMHLLFTAGTPLARLPLLPVTITREGLIRGGLVAWQFLLLASFGTVLAATTAPTDLIAALERLLRPLEALRVPTRDIAVMVSMALRFVPTFREEYERLRWAQAARGASMGTGRLAARCRSLTTLVIPLLDSALRRADDLADAMEARGYAGQRRTTLSEPRFGREEWLALAGLALPILGMTLARLLPF